MLGYIHCVPTCVMRPLFCIGHMKLDEFEFSPFDKKNAVLYLLLHNYTALLKDLPSSLSGIFSVYLYNIGNMAKNMLNY